MIKEEKSRWERLFDTVFTPRERFVLRKLMNIDLKLEGNDKRLRFAVSVRDRVMFDFHSDREGLVVQTLTIRSVVLAIAIQRMAEISWDEVEDDD